MGQRYAQSILLLSFITHIIALHPYTYTSRTSGTSYIILIEWAIFLGMLVCVFLGCFLTLCGLKHRSSFLQKVAGVFVWVVLIVVTSACGNAAQTEMAGALGNSMLGMLIGGAVGGLIAASGGLVIQFISKISPFHLALLGITLILFGLFIESVQIALLLLTQTRF